MILPKLPNAEIRDTGTPKGRGVFALQDYEKNNLVEICPVIVFQCPYVDLPTELQLYVFGWSDLCGSCVANLQALAMGYGGLYNGDNPANMRYESVDGSQKLQRFIAVRHISAGEELTINYSGKRGAAISEGNRWFDFHGIVPIFSNPQRLGSSPWHEDALKDTAARYEAGLEHPLDWAQIRRQLRKRAR